MFLYHKLNSTVENSQVIYYHPFDQGLTLNSWVGSNVSISATSQKVCLGCQKSVKKIVQGYCCLCSRRLARCDMCILKPYLCHYHLGTCREPEWGQEHCMKEHVIYLSLTSGLKVGLTRKSQYMTRWIDQGATSAAILATLPSRYQAGLLEEFLSRDFNDKTNWRHLLTGQSQGEQEFESTFYHLKQLIVDQKDIKLDQLEVYPYEQMKLNYPVDSYLEKAKSINLDKTPFFQDKLVGIRGQYLLFETLGGLNLRKYQGYDISIECDT